jgi:hypothetical protein
VKYLIEEDEYTVLNSSNHLHTRCGIYYYENKIYALFGIDTDNNKYIEVYSIATDNWLSFIVSNDDIPIIYNAKGIFKDDIDINTNIHSATVLIFWGTNTEDGTVTYSKIIKVELLNSANISNAVTEGPDLDTAFNYLRYVGYSLSYNSDNTTVYISNGIVSGTNNISKKIYRFNLNSYTLISSLDNEKPTGTFNSITGLYNQNLYVIGGYTSVSLSINENLNLFNIREGSWSNIKSLAYNPGKITMNGVVPVITAMKVIYPGDILIISYMDGSVGSLDLRTGDITLPTEINQQSLRCIHAPPGIYSDRGAYLICEDEEDVIFTCVDNEFKYAKNVGVFFRKMPSDSTDITFTLDSELPYPVGGCSQVAIGKYIIYLGGYNSKETNYLSTLHKNVIVLDTSTGNYETLAVDKLIRYKYNAFSHYYNGYIYTFGGICKEDQWDEVEQKNIIHYIRRAVIERYDLVSGKVIELPIKYGIELNNTENKNVGKNQIVHLAPVSYFGKRNQNNSILGSVITPNSNEANGNLIKQWFFFDLSSETLYKEFS